LLPQENNSAAAGNVDYNSWTFFVGFDSFFVGANPGRALKWKLQTLEAFLNLEYTTGFEFPAMQENSQQQKSDQIKILHL
jgi:hypothetical protein